jgi:phosphoglycerate dehydrogenase-like enzyme
VRTRPTAAIALHPKLCEGLLTPAHRARLEALCELPDPEPLASFDDGRARALLARVDVLLTGWGCPPITPRVLEAAPRLRAVAHAAGTVKHHVTPEALQRLAVSSAAAANALPVAEYTVAAILFANKRVFAAREGYRQVRGFRFWSQELPGLGNYGKTVGLIGASRIGRRVAELLRPFELRVLVADPFLDDAEAARLGVTRVELDALLRASDVVSLHAPLLPETRGLLDARRLALLRDGATLINTARGGLVDTAALEAELASGRIAAVLDTTEPEPLPPDSLLYDLPHVFLTPHVAGALGAETHRLVDLALDEIERFARGEPFAHPVRAEEWERIA